MEAMSQAVPVISTRLSGIPELVLHEQTGLLAEPDDHMDLARQIDRLLTSVALRKSIAETAIVHVEREFGTEINLDRLIMHFGMGAEDTTLRSGR
jgi:glycosyltransferase involved in cell wall biosynthesis